MGDADQRVHGKHLHLASTCVSTDFKGIYYRYRLDHYRVRGFWTEWERDYLLLA